MTGRYLVLDVDRLRHHMSRISEAFLELLEISNEQTNEWKFIEPEDTNEVTQLLIPFSNK